MWLYFFPSEPLGLGFKLKTQDDKPCTLWNSGNSASQIAPKPCEGISPEVEVVNEHSTGDNGHEMPVRENDTLSFLQLLQRHTVQATCDVLSRSIHTVALHIRPTLKSLTNRVYVAAV